MTKCLLTILCFALTITTHAQQGKIVTAKEYEHAESLLIYNTEALVDHEPAGHILVDVERAHGGIVDAIASLDPMMAQRRMIRHFQAMTRVGWPDDGQANRAGEP